MLNGIANLVSPIPYSLMDHLQWIADQLPSTESTSESTDYDHESSGDGDYSLPCNKKSRLAHDPLRGSRGPVFTNGSRRSNDEVLHLPTGEVSHHGPSPPTRFRVLEDPEEFTTSHFSMALRRSPRQATDRPRPRLLPERRHSGLRASGIRRTAAARAQERLSKLCGSSQTRETEEESS